MNEKQTSILTVYLVDDEPFAVQNMSRLLENYCLSLRVIGSANDADSAIEQIHQLKPDVLFLDVSMPKKNGFELVNMLQYSPSIVFVTAHEQFALRAIKLSAVDFLLKPIDISELLITEKKLLNIQSFSSQLKEEYRSVLTNMAEGMSNPAAIKRITLPVSNGYKIVSIEDILYLKGDDNYTIFYLRDASKVLVSKTLKEYEGLLETFGFLRIHKSYIINIVHLKNVLKDDGLQVKLNDDTILPVSRRRAHELMERTKTYLG